MSMSTFSYMLMGHAHIQHGSTYGIFIGGDILQQN